MMLPYLFLQRVCRIALLSIFVCMHMYVEVCIYTCIHTRGGHRFTLGVFPQRSVYLGFFFKTGPLTGLRVDNLVRLAG